MLLSSSVKAIAEFGTVGRSLAVSRAMPLRGRPFSSNAALCACGASNRKVAAALSGRER